MSDSVRPHRWQPTRLPHPWDSPGKNTGVGCHFLLQCIKVKSESEFAQSCLTLRDAMDCSPPGSSVHGILQARVLEWGAIAFSVWWFYGGVNGDLLLEGLYCIQVCFTLPLRQSTAHLNLCRRQPNTVLSHSLWGLWVLVHTGLFESTEHLWWLWGLILKAILPLLHLARAPPLPLNVGYLLKVSSAPHSRCSSTYHLVGASLPLDVGYLLIATPAHFLQSYESFQHQIPFQALIGVAGVGHSM